LEDGSAEGRTKSEDVGVSILTLVSKYGASSPWSRLHKGAAILSSGADYGQL